MLPSRFVAAFRAHFPDLLGQPILTALSGGSDSVALLALLHENLPALGCPVFAVHVHHHARGASADEDAAFCARLCADLGVPLHVAHLLQERPHGVSREAWWRRERYRQLEAARHELKCAATATAHTEDDQAETVLFKLLRGTGPRGAAGVRRRVGSVIRPVLGFGRDELRAWLRERELCWRDDASNSDDAQPRAWLRRHVLPLVKDRFPGAARHLAEYAEVTASDEILLGTLLGELALWPVVGRPVALAAVAQLAEPLRRRWTLELAARLDLTEPPSRVQLAAVEALLAGQTPAAVDLGRRWVLRRQHGLLHLSPPPCSPFPSQAATVPSRLTLPGGFEARLGLEAGATRAHRVWLSSSVRDLPLAWRSLVPGERFGTPSRPAAKLLSLARVPAPWRRAWPVLESGDTMLWLPGVGVAQGWAGEVADGILAELEEPWQPLAR